MTTGAWSHPFLFFLIGALAIASVGLVANQVHERTDGPGDRWPSDEYQNRMYFLLFVAAWTTLGAVLHWVINLFIGLFWTILTFVFWTIATALYRKVNPFDPSDCDDTGIASTCRQSVAIEAIGWTEVALTALLFLAILFHFHSHRRAGRDYRNAGYDGFYA
ncbi:hypothetical protein MNV49_003401 [Pseudohyphozyma bogoriensis]|nr:hypothetical protein MNV49_003401 [Pseudohyphozyma bogoriensis]